MKWLQIVALLAAVVGANAGCLASCAAQPCKSASIDTSAADPNRVPPCHRHRSEKGSSHTSDCAHSLTLSGAMVASSANSPFSLAHAFIAQPACGSLTEPLARSSSLPRFQSSPPGLLACQASTVLRI